MTNARARITPDGVRRGFLQMAPVAAFVVPFGLAFGVAAQTAMLTDPQTLFVSASVFAAASQFAVLEIWGPTVPLVPLILITLAVNARHILVGAALYPWLSQLSWPQRLWSVFFISDANFGIATVAYDKGERDFGTLVGGGLALWSAWMTGTAGGIVFGSRIGDPKTFALDVVMITFFAALLAGAWKGNKTLFPWLVAGAASLAAWHWLPPNWHVIVGAFAGGMTGALRNGD